jgi:hypothetical protein
MAPMLPIAETVALNARDAISTAKMSSVVPMIFETAWTLNIEYIQDINGLFDTNGCIACASTFVNLKDPKNNSIPTKP